MIEKLPSLPDCEKYAEIVLQDFINAYGGDDEKKALNHIIEIKQYYKSKCKKLQEILDKVCSNEQKKTTQNSN